METNLTPSQLEVIRFPYKPKTTLKVVAGPGSGKTITLLHKVHHLISSGQVKPNEVLILSLTNKAVDNIIDKLLSIFEALNGDMNYSEEELKDIVTQIGVYTVHGLANRVVIENEGIINIIEENGWRGLMKLVSQDFWKGKSSKLTRTKEFERLFKEYKLGNGKKNEVMEKLTEIMRSCKVVTNDDLIILASEYLEKPSLSAKDSSEATFTGNLKEKYKIVLIDEFQDLFPSLLPLLNKVSLDKQLILFGDSNQNIYEFLGSNKAVLKSLEKIHGIDQLTVMHLHDNFRCTPEIMSAATGIICDKATSKNKYTSELVLKESCGVMPQINEIVDPVNELEFLTDQICQLVCSSAKLSDIAILTRTNAHLQTIADHLQAYKINFQKLTAQPDWMTDIRIQFLIDLLKVVTLVYREDSSTDSKRTLTGTPWRSDFSIIVTLSAIKGIGTQSIQNLYMDCRKRKLSLWKYITEVPKSEWPQQVTVKKKIEAYTAHLKGLVEGGAILKISDPMQLLKEISKVAHELDYYALQLRSGNEATEFKSHLEDMFKVMKLCAFNKPDDLSLAEWFLETYFDQSMIYHHINPNLESEGLGAVKLSTIHSSKGLEFPIVFLVGGFYSNFPVEDKVLYVGMTRARNLLYLNNVKHPKINPGSWSLTPPLLSNEAFWKYYNRDLNRPLSASNSNRKYEFLQKKYAMGTLSERGYSTYCRRSVFRLCKNLLR